MTARVLVLDDNHDLAESVRDVLELERELSPLSVTIAHDAASGLARARAEAFDVAIVDVRLPDASGLDLIAPLREAHPWCEVVLLTGNATVESAIRALRLGAAGFVLKSFRPEELVATVSQALEKSRLRRERQKFENRYHALVTAAEVLIVGLDPAGCVAFVNPKLGVLLGTEESGAAGAVFAQRWVADSDAARFESACRAALAGGGKGEVEVGLRSGDGAVRRVRWHLSAAQEAEPGADHVYGIGIDVTERRALERRAADAEALNAMAPLAMGLAHEIRNPLNAAVLALHLLSRSIERMSEPEAREPMQKRVGVIESEIRRLERLLTEFLQLARPRPPRREALELAPVVSEVLDLEGEAMRQREVRLEKLLEPGVVVLGDPEKLKQVILNLIVNALDVMTEGGLLMVTLERQGHEAVLSFADDGPGIDPRHLGEVFDPFFTTKPAGTGLGLAIVRKLAEQHGGRVSLTARPEGGTTATVRLPLADGPGNSAVPEVARPHK